MSSTKPPTGKPRLKLAKMGHVIASSLAGSILLAAATLVCALWLIGFPELVPPKSGLSLGRLLDLVKISFGVVAGVGAVVAVIVAYRRQKVDEAAAQRAEAAEARETAKLFNERFSTASEKLGHDAPAVRLAAVHALAALADDAFTRGLRQMVIDVLCAYLRMPYTPAPDKNGPQTERIAFSGLREVRHTIIRLISSHLREDAATSWQGYNFDLTGTVFDGADFRRIIVTGGQVSFNNARFLSGEIDFTGSKFLGGEISFEGASFTGARTWFSMCDFSGTDFLFNKIKVTAGDLSFSEGVITGGKIGFHNSTFSGGSISFLGTAMEGGTVWFGTTNFSGSSVYMDVMRITGGFLNFKWVRFSEGTLSFDSTDFSGGTVLFGGAEFSGGSVRLNEAKFNGGTVAIDSVKDYSAPPLLPKPQAPGLSLQLNDSLDRHTRSVMEEFGLIKTKDDA